MSGYDDPSPHDETLPPQEPATQPAAREPAPGDLVGRYRIESVLGRGAMGVVYRAHAEHLGRDVAMKVVSGAWAGIREAHARFEREARAAGRAAAHAGIAGVHDLGEVNGLPYLVMELVEGPTLQECLDTERFDDRGFVQRTVEAARAVHHAHTQGVLHRDIKPANLLVAQDGTTRVTDFGLASLALTGAQLTRLTAEGRAVGTPAFMPPEQARGEACDARSDVYSLGATLFHCLARRAPIDDGAVPEMVQWVIDGKRLPLGEARPDADAGLVAIVERALRTRPVDRYSSAAEFADDLERWLAGAAIEAAPAPGPASSPVPRGVVWTAVAGVVVAGLAWGLWWSTTQWGANTQAMQAAAAAAEQAESRAVRAQAFAALAQRTADSIARLEDHSHGVRLSDPELAAEIAGVEEACRAVPQADGAPWIAFARWLSEGKGAGLSGLEAAVKAAGDHPEVVSLLIRARALAYVRALPQPAHRVTVDGVSLMPTPERPDTTKAREALDAAVELWRARRDAAGSATGGTLGAFAEGAKALAENRADEAQHLLAPLQDDKFVGLEAGLLYGYALQSAGRYHESALCFEPLARRGWTLGIEMAARVRLLDAVDRFARREESTAAFQRANVLLRDWASTRPESPWPDLLRGTGWELRADIDGRLNPASRDELQAAADAYTAAVERAREAHAAQVGLVRVHVLLALSFAQQGEDLDKAEHHLQLAIESGRATRARGYKPKGLRKQLGDACLHLSKVRNDRRGDPTPHAREARELYEEIVAEREDPAVLMQLGLTWDYEGRYALRTRRPALESYRKAAQWFGRASAAAPDSQDARHSQAVATNEVGNQLRKLQKPLEAAAAFDAAAKLHEQQIARFPSEKLMRTRILLGGIRSNQALALVEAGRSGREAFTQSIAVLEEAVRLDPQAPSAHRWLANSYRGRARLDLSQRRPTTVAADLEAAIASYERAVALHPAWERNLAGRIADCRALLARNR